MASLLGWAKKKVQGGIQTVQRDIVAPVAHAASNVEHAAGNTVNAVATGARDVGGAAQATGRFIAATPNQQQIKTQGGPFGSINRALNSPGLGVQRSVIGTAQGVSGLADLAGSSKGTSQFSKNLQKAALSTDKQGKASAHPLLYKGGQTLGDLSTFALGGAASDAAKVGIKALPTGAKVLNAGGKIGSVLSRPLVNASENLAKHGLAGRAAGAGVKGLIDSKNIAGNAALTALQTGANASKGRKTTPSSVAAGLAEGTAFSGLTPVVGQVTKEALAPAIKTATKALQAAHLARPSALNDSEVNHLGNFMNARGTTNMTEDVYNKGIAAAQKAHVDPNNPQAIDNLLGAHVTHATVVQQRAQALQALKAKLTPSTPLGEGGYIRPDQIHRDIVGRFASKPAVPEDHIPIYHGTPEKFDTFDNERGGGSTWFTDHKASIKDTGLSYNGSQPLNIMERHLPKSLKLADENLNDRLTSAQLIHEGYHGVKYDNGDGTHYYEMFDPEKSLKRPPTNLPLPTSPAEHPLAAEARKYGSADEFRRSLIHNDDVIIHQTGKKTADTIHKEGFKAGSQTGLGEKRDHVYGMTAHDWMKHGRMSKDTYARDGSGVGEVAINTKGLKIFDRSKQKFTDEEYVAGVHKQIPEGYDGVKVGYGNGVNETLLTPEAANKAKFNIDDIYNQAHATAQPAKQSLKEKLGIKPLDQSGHIQVRGGKDVPELNRKNSSVDSIAPKGQSAATPTTPTIELPAKVAPEKLSKYASTTVPTSNYVSKDVGAAAKANAPSYIPETDRGRYTDSLSRLKQQGEDTFTANLTDKLNAKRGQIDSSTVSDTQALAAIYDARRDPVSIAKAADLYDKLSDHLTAQGQSIQAASLLSRQTPQGLQYGAQKSLKKAGVKLTPEVQAKLSAAIDEVKGAKSQTERDYAVKKVQKVVSDHTPTSAADKISSIWKAGLLTGVKTQTGNWLSNGTFGALHAVSNPLAVGIDKALSLVTKERTKSLTGKGLVSGTVEGTKKAGSYLKTGIDERKVIDNKYDTHGEVNFKNKALNIYVNGVFRIMGAADRPAYYSQLRNSLHDLALTDAANKGIKSANVAAHVKEFVSNPSTAAFQIATNEAEKGVLANDTALSKIIGSARQGINRIDNKLARGTASTAMNLVAPFTKVPSAFLSRVVDFSPLGAVKEAAMQISNKKLDQRSLATALSEATTGTAIVYLGFKAAQNNMLSGNYPSDPKEQQRWKADGIQPNSLKVGDKWLSLNYFGPLGLLFNAGQRVNDSAKQGDNVTGQTISAVAGAPKDLLGQSFLQGLSGAANAVNDPQRYAKSYVNSTAGSVVPTIIGDIAGATDKLQRQPNTAGQTIQSKIPGLRQQLNPKQDVYGNPLLAKAGGIDIAVNPLRPSQDISKSNPVLTEVNRLHAVNPGDTSLQVTPTPVGKTVTVEKNTVPLNDKQRYDLQRKVGQETQKQWGALIQTPEYKALDDTGKAKALGNLRTDATTLATRQYVLDNNLGTYAKSPSKSVQALGSTSDVTAYTKTKTASSASTANNATPAQKYKTALDNYQKNKSKMSDVQKYSTESNLAKLKVAAPFSSDVMKLYGMSKQAAYDYVTNNQDGKKLADQLTSYDQALYDAGLSSYLKYKNGIAPDTKKTSGGGTSRTRTGNSTKSTASTTIKGIQAATSSRNSVKKITTSKAPSYAVKAGQIPASYKKTALKKYAVAKPKVSLRQLAKLT